jgi:hypothetical protein
MPAVARLISDHCELVEAVRDRVNEMGLTRLELDHQSGMPSGYSGKLLGQKNIKSFGWASLGSVLGAIGCKLVLIEDPEQTAKMRARITPRQRPIRQAASAGP